MPQLTPYLSFDGTCAEAMQFYARTLNAKLEALITFAETPVADTVPAGGRDRIMHAYLVGDGFVLMAGDAPEEGKYELMKGISLTLTYDNAAKARPVFDALAEGGRVTMPFAETFWAEGAGMLIDRYGTSWIINGRQKSV
jgi:PhnB protein